MKVVRRCGLAFWLLWWLAAVAHAAPTQFTISFPASAHAEAITGRAFVFIARTNEPEPRLQAGGGLQNAWEQQTPLFGADLTQLKPGQAAIIDAATLGYPPRSLIDIPAGDYFVQALISVYTKFHRADGHTIWAHLDQGEGQQFNMSPGSLYSEVQQVHLDPAAGYDIKLDAAQVIPPIPPPADTPWVKHIRIESKLLSKFWGRPIYLGATVLLPKGYDAHADVRYPVIYDQEHFSPAAPLFFDNQGPVHRHWTGEHFPRFLAVRFTHPTPYFDDSYAVNSANNGPYGDAILQELIPYVEEHFRIIREPWARLLTGVSTGGWEALALQVLHPDFFGGTWTFSPDPVDFRRYQLVNIYYDENAFEAPGAEWLPRERPMMRNVEGQVLVTIRQMSQLEAVLGSRSRSGQQFSAWEAVYGPVGPDGYPQPLWDRLTGKIDRRVADYMRDHGYDLRAYLEKNWSKIGPQLAGKIHVYCGDMDDYYLNSAVYKLEEFLKATTNPPYGGSFQYGRPMKGHGWSPVTKAEMVKEMAEHIRRTAPKGHDSAAWNY